MDFSEKLKLIKVPVSVAKRLEVLPDEKLMELSDYVKKKAKDAMRPEEYMDTIVFLTALTQELEKRNAAKAKVLKKMEEEHERNERRLRAAEYIHAEQQHIHFERQEQLKRLKKESE